MADICEASLTSTENAVEVHFDSAHHPSEEVWPGEDIPSVGHMGGWTAAGQDLDLQKREGEDLLVQPSHKYCYFMTADYGFIDTCSNLPKQS